MEEIHSDSESVDMSLLIDETIESNRQRLHKKFVYEVLGVEQIVRQMQECIEEVKAVIQLPSSAIRTLLKHFKWDTQKLFEQLFESNEEKLFKDVGIVLNVDTSEATESKRRKVDSGSVDCMICYIEEDLKQMFSLECNHLYCKKCWNQYLTTKIMSEGNINAITCAETDCKIIVDDEQVLQLLSETSVKVKYERFTTNSYVESNRLLRWCPRPDCMHAFSVKFNEAHHVVCVCGTQLCFGCGESNHEPIDCNLLREWNKKSSGNGCEEIDAQTAQWILSNTKECPKCRTIIEKNGGCNHMTCKSIECRYEFCWVCLGSWKTHRTDYYNCNNYNDSKAKQIKESQSDKRKALEKYMFYWNRFMNHKQSLKFENELHSTVKTKMIEMQDKFEMAWVEVQFMKEAVDVLCSCRQTLMYTYVFAYYNLRTQQLVIFEDNQRDLQRAVETLSQYLEQEIHREEDQKVQEKVVHLTNYCRNRRKTLIDHILEGNEKECWKYSV